MRQGSDVAVRWPCRRRRWLPILLVLALAAVALGPVSAAVAQTGPGDDGGAAAPAGYWAEVKRSVKRFEAKIDGLFGHVTYAINRYFFFGIGSQVERDADGAPVLDSYGRPQRQGGIPFIVAWLLAGAIFFTLRMGFINLRAFRHAVRVLRGRFNDPSDQGEVSHFQALSSALSATVGLGNIAGVAIAVRLGGPGAVFWMMFAGVLGMSSKFVECTLGQMYRHVDPGTGRVSGGPMRYLADGLAGLKVRGVGLGGLGRVLAVVFAVTCILGSFGGGNMFQANQAYSALSDAAPGWVDGHEALFGVVMALLVGVVIIGGIRRIARVAATIVPFMCGTYLLAALVIVVASWKAIPGVAWLIVSQAFQPDAALYGGFMAVFVMGLRRAAFSNEAGIGSAAIAHSAARTDEPVREGVVALLEPFIDTVVICFMTATVILVTGVYADPSLAEVTGSALTAAAFRTVLPWFPYVLTAAILLFAYSTMISWSYYGERCWAVLFGEKSSLVYRCIFLFFVFLGSVASIGHVLDFSDAAILAMAFPNVLGAMLLSGQVRRALDDYWGRLLRGEMPENAPAAPAAPGGAGVAR